MVVVVGGGPVGLAAAMLLAADGHAVSVLERDPDGPPATAAEAFELWDRAGVAQFRMAHGLLPKLYQLLQAELPRVADELFASGGCHMNLVDTMPATVADRSPRPGDDRLRTLTGRRPFVERAFATVAENTGGVRGTISDGSADVGTVNIDGGYVPAPGLSRTGTTTVTLS